MNSCHIKSLKYELSCKFYLFLDYEIIYRDEYDGLSILDVKTFRRIPLVPNTTYSNLNAASYQISADKKFVLLAHDSQKVSFCFTEYFFKSINRSKFAFRCFATPSGPSTQFMKSPQGKRNPIF